ncbi:hypothetical protein KUTeg_011136 [Tegillarca granosa]|uniref:HECT domain-containing protein n=1 Tax=Tegillarca granosa TaxID=220873 RepID=A0ABQ9F1N9_TEGGR|nr:hypothetical protein KUTeg_011136 [Tegillarca granosa]
MSPVQRSNPRVQSKNPIQSKSPVQYKSPIQSTFYTKNPIQSKSPVQSKSPIQSTFYTLPMTLIDLVCQRFVGKLQTFDEITLDPQHRISYYSQNGKKINLRLIEESISCLFEWLKSLATKYSFCRLKIGSVVLKAPSKIRKRLEFVEKREVNTNETHTRNEDFQIGARYCTSTDADNIVRKALIDINTAEEPTFILNKYKMCFLQGRPLGCTAENATIEGETSPIFVRRGYEYVDAIDELVTLDYIRFPLEVGYYGEEAVDLGGPRTEFFTASINYIKEHFVEIEGTDYTGSIRKDVNFVINKGYYVAGLLIGLSAIQNGPCADFLDCLIRSETWIEGQEHLEMFKLGLKKTGLLQLLERKPSLRFLFQKRQGMLTVSKLINFLQPNFSEDGSNRRLHENNSYKVFIKYLREVAAGRRPPVSLNKVLQFISAYEEEPYLGFPMIPTVRFAELPGNIPTSNTCIFQLTLPLLESANEDVFEKFDLAFMNAFFGLQ